MNLTIISIFLENLLFSVFLFSNPEQCNKKIGLGLNMAIYSKETTLEKTLKTKKKKKKKTPVRERDGEQGAGEVNEQDEDEEGDGNEGEQENSGHREKASSALIPPKKGKPRRKTKVKEEALDMPGSLDIEQKALTGRKL